MPIRYISLFSGIKAWSCAVAGMPEYEAVAFSEIDPFACAVLKHHYPDVPNLGDITQVDWSKYHGLVDLIVGGSPCQGFSQAGYRKGLRDSRSSLALAYVQAVEQIQPRWLLWENVPGVLSTNDGEDFRAFLAALDDLGFGLAWAVLDSQWFGVAQRRRRVFVVGHLGGWEPAAQVLFERSCLQRNPPSRRKAGQEDTRRSQGGAGNSRLAGTLCASGAGLDRSSASGNQLDYCVVDSPKTYQIDRGSVSDSDVSCTVDTTVRNGPMQMQVGMAIVEKEAKASRPAYAVRTAQTGANGIGIAEDSAHTLDGAGVQAVATVEQFVFRGPICDGICGTVTAKWAKGTGGHAGNECYNLVITKKSM